MLFLIWLILDCLMQVKGLQCYHCSNIQNASSCNEIYSCPSHEYCYHSLHTNGLTHLHSLGCATSQECGSVSNPQNSTVGRSLPDNSLDFCHECCSLDTCNKNLCNYEILASTCQDKPGTDCAELQSIFHVCSDIHHAKLVCKKFCGLCNLVDGQWSNWGEWGDCSVTCGNGTITRTRTCTNPAPANGGLNCNGSSSDYKSCTKAVCPVHGGWSNWANWSSCSVTCGVGLSSRRRLCNNPLPSICGNHCFGDSSEYKTCSNGCSCSSETCNADNFKNISNAMGSCTCNEQGLSCTTTCLSGSVYRNGASMKTYHCTGNNNWSPALPPEQCQEYVQPTYGFSVKLTYEMGSVPANLCSKDHEMKIQHSLSTFGSQAVCPGTDGGIIFAYDNDEVQVNSIVTSFEFIFQNKNLTDLQKVQCYNIIRSKILNGSINLLYNGTLNCGSNFPLVPVSLKDSLTMVTRGINKCPAKTSKQNTDVGGEKCLKCGPACPSCKDFCSDHAAYFSVQGPYKYDWTTQKLIFGQVMSNTGSFVDGVFTCPYSGSYFFSVQLVQVLRGSNTSVHAWCTLVLGSVRGVYIGVGDTTQNAVASNTAVVHLNKDDQVYLTGCSDPKTTMTSYSTFTGFLVHADNQQP